MSNIIDYVKWRGDIRIEEDGFHAVDALILSNCCYIHFDEMLDKQSKTIGQLGKEFNGLSQYEKENKWRVEDDHQLLLALMNSKRFSRLEVSDYMSQYDFEQEMQFSAMSVHLPHEILYVTFRGTDGSYIGWKEDFNMFSRDEIPAQRMAIQYLEKMANKYPKKQLIVAGHSKGGNMAIYSVAKNDKFVRNRVKRIYNFDGPGFSEGFLNLESYQEIRKKIQMIVPQSSFFGLIFNHDVKMEIVKSNQMGVMQHDAYSWEVEGSSFVHVRELSTTSNLLENTLNHVLDKLTVDQRKQLVDIIYQAFANEASNDVGNWFKNIKAIVKEAQTLDREKTMFLSDSIGVLFEAAKDTITETIIPWRKTNQEQQGSNPLYHQLNIEGAYNVRELGGYLTSSSITNEHIFLRSDSTSNLTSNDIDWLKAYGLTTVIDLRSTFELMREPSIFENRGDISYVSIPMLDQIQSNGLTSFPSSLFETYLGLLEYAKQDYQKIFNLLAQAEGTVLFHCTAGKDRTGVLAMLLLDLAGVSREVIVQDYAVTCQLIQPLIHVQLTELEKHGVQGIDYLFDSNAETMYQTLDYLSQHYENAEQYLLNCGVSAETIEKIKQKFVK